MPHNVLQRLNKAKGQDSSVNADVTDRLYNQLMTDIKLKAQEDARKESRAEMESLRAETLRVEAERDAARVLKESADNLANDLKSKIALLESDLRSKERSLVVGKQEFTDSSQSIRSDLSKAQLKVQELELELATLNGKLSEKGKKVIVKSTPMAMPDFDITPVRGSDGKIMSARLKAVTH